jgi:DNA modification methylase
MKNIKVVDQVITDKYAIYQGDSVEVLKGMPAKSVHLSIYSPPFAGLYHYSSDERDMSNCRSYDEFLEHYSFLVAELARVTKPGRISAVHCMDVPSGNTGRDHMLDFPGDIIRLHEKHGFKFACRYAVWKDPFVVYLRTLQKSLRHRTCVEDSSRCSAAAADYLLMFRREGENKEPIAHPEGLLSYAGSKPIPADLLPFKGWKGKQTENKYSQWIWRQYASAFWDDVRLDRVLPFRDAKDPEDEKHVHPLQLDVIERAVTLWSNPGDVVLTPFMGVGSEVYGAVINGRRGVGVELKSSYFRQAKLNVEAAASGRGDEVVQQALFRDESKTTWLEGDDEVAP